eukprot:1136893-Pelagomonas_calceolata.AAC.4
MTGWSKDYCNEMTSPPQNFFETAAWVLSVGNSNGSGSGAYIYSLFLSNGSFSFIDVGNDAMVHSSKHNFANINYGKH